MERIQPSELLVKEFAQDRRAKKLSLSEVVLRSAQVMLQRAIEEEVQEFLGRGYYKRSEESEEFRGYRNGYEPKKIRTGEGTIELKVPQVRQSRERFRSAFLEAYTRRTEKLDELILKIAVRGLSVRDIEETMLEILSGEGISRSVISRISDQLHSDFEAWRKRDLSKKKSSTYSWMEHIGKSGAEYAAKKLYLPPMGSGKMGKKSCSIFHWATKKISKVGSPFCMT